MTNEPCEHKQQVVEIIAKNIRGQWCLKCKKCLFSWNIVNDRPVEPSPEPYRTSLFENKQI